jgi:hypothetical protein
VLREIGIVNYAEHELPEYSGDANAFPAGHQVTTKREDSMFFLNAPGRMALGFSSCPLWLLKFNLTD